MTAFFGYPVRQLGYYVSDAFASAKIHSELFGSGPFFTFDMPITCWYRGVSGISVNLSVALGQWGDQMVEFVQQNDDQPSVFHDLYPQGSGRYGLHHVAVIVEDVKRAVADIEGAGHPLVSITGPAQGPQATFIDTRGICGHFTEIFASIPQVNETFAFIASAAGDFKGKERVRPMPGT